MSSIDSTALSSTPATNPATSASAQPSSSASAPAVTPAAAAASPATSLLSGIPQSILPFSQAASLVDWLDVQIQAHPWAAPLLYVSIAYGLQMYNDKNAIRGYDETVAPRWTPHQLQITAVLAFTAALFGLKTIHTQGIQWIPTQLQFLFGSDASGLSYITPFVSRFFYCQIISFPLIAWGTIALLPNEPPLHQAGIAAGLMLAPLGYALAINWLGLGPLKKTTAVPSPTSVG